MVRKCLFCKKKKKKKRKKNKNKGLLDILVILLKNTTKIFCCYIFFDLVCMTFLSESFKDELPQVSILVEIALSNLVVLS